MIVDAFLFFNELDLLKIRLEELRDVVDRFVLVEAPVTFSGARKPLYFERYRDLFSEYADRIHHHVVADMPRFGRTNRYIRQFHQRDSIGVALERAGCRLPAYLHEHRDLFPHFFEPVNAPEEEDESTERYGEAYNFRRRLYARFELAVETGRRFLWDNFPRFTASVRRLLRL